MSNSKVARWQRFKRRLILFSVLGAFFGVIALYSLAPRLLEPRLREFLVSWGGEKLKGEVVIGDMILRSIVPFVVRLRQLQVMRTDGTLQVVLPELDIDVGFGNPLADFPRLQMSTRLYMTDPFIRLTVLPGEEEQDSREDDSDAEEDWGFSLPVSFDSSMDVSVSRGQVEVIYPADDSGEGDTQLFFKSISLLFRQDSLFNNHSPMNFNLDLISGLQMGKYVSTVPIKISSEEIFTTPRGIEAKRINVDFGGLLAAAGGSTQFKPLEHNWLVRFQVPELSQLKVPPQFLPKGTWAGAFSGKVHFAKKPKETPYWAIQAVVKGFRGDLNWKKDSIEVGGGLGADMRLDAVYWDQWKFNELFAIVDLSGARIHVDPWFHKEPNERLRLEAVGKFENDEFNLEKGDLEFKSLKGYARGRVQGSKGGQSKLQFKIPPTELSGFDSHFPFIKDQSLQGTFEVNARVEGDLSDIENLAVDLAPLRLSGVSGQLAYKSKDTKTYLGGPFQMNSEVVISAKGKELMQGKVQMALDLSRAAVVVGESIRKKPGEALSIRANGNKLGQQIVLSSLSLAHPVGEFHGTGAISQPQRPNFNFMLNLGDLNLRRMAGFIPAISAYGMSGTVGGGVSVSGVYDYLLGVERSQIKLDGQLNVKLQNLSLPSPLRAKGQTEAPAHETAEHQPKALLPDWPLVNDSQVKLNAQAQQVALGNEIFRQVQLKGDLQQGRLDMELKVGSAWGGSLEATNASLPLRQVLPIIPAKLKIQRLNLNQMVRWFYPERKDWLAGLMDFEGNASIPWPGPPEWWQGVRVDGNLRVQNFSLSSLDLEEQILSGLNDLPGLDNVSRRPARRMVGELTSQFATQEGRIQVKTLKLKTADKNDLEAEGEVDFSLAGVLKGEASLANPPIQGSILAANSDELGRLVVPFEMSGDLTQPNFEIAKHIIEKMVAKAMAFEGKRPEGPTGESQVPPVDAKKTEVKGSKKKESIEKRMKKLFERK